MVLMPIPGSYNALCKRNCAGLLHFQRHTASVTPVTPRTCGKHGTNNATSLKYLSTVDKQSDPSSSPQVDSALCLIHASHGVRLSNALLVH